MAILLDKCPRAGRPLKDLAFQFDKEQSIMAYKIGYIECQCGKWHSVAITNGQLEKFMASVYYTHKKINKVKKISLPIKQKIGEWLIGKKQPPDDNNVKNLFRLPDGSYITR